MKMRTWAAGPGLSLLMVATTLAQPASRPGGSGGPGERGGERGGERPMMLLERARTAMSELGLSDEQKTKVEAVFKKAKDNLETMRAQLMAMEPRDRMQKVQELVKGMRNDLTKVLDEKQIAALDKKLEEARQTMRSRFGGNGPTTGPPGPGGPGGPQALLERLRDNLGKLDLSDEQKTKIKSVFEDVKSKAQGLREQAQGGSQEAREKLRDLFQQTREEFNDILTPEQQEKLRSMMRPEGRPTSRSTSRPGQAQMTGDKDETMAGGEMKDADMKGADAGSGKPRGNARERVGERQRRRGGDAVQPAPEDPGKAALAAKPGPQVGDPAPPLALKKTDGALVQLSSLKGRVIVLEFGSYTCPAFRDRAAAMEKLKNDYGTRAEFFVVYQREAHAKGEWEVSRNKDKEISIDQPRTVESRLDLAMKAKQELKITLPILLDTIGNDTAVAYGAGANSAFLINRDGSIAARQDWFDPSGLRREIDEAVKVTPTTKSTPAVTE